MAMDAKVCIDRTIQEAALRSNPPIDRPDQFMVPDKTMTRFLILLATLLPLFAAQTRAQPKQTPAISADEARAALETLNDPKKRAAFAATLEALLKAQPPGQKTQAPEPPPEDASKQTTVEGVSVPLAPDSLGAQVLLSGSSFVNDLGNDLTRMYKALESLPLLWAWLVVMATNPLGQRLLIETGWRLAVAMALALGAKWALGRAVRPVLDRVTATGRTPIPPAPHEDPEARAELGDIEPPPRRRFATNFGRRLQLGLARFGLQVVPLVGLFIVGHAVAGSTLGGQQVSQLVVLAVTDAATATGVLLAVIAFLFKPDPPELKLFNISSAMGAYLMLWGRRLILIGVLGYMIGEVGLLLGLSNPAHDAVQKTAGLALRVCLGIMIVQRRRQVRILLSTAQDAEGLGARLRNRLARYWWTIALFFLAVSWLNWVFHAPDVFGRSVWYCTITAGIFFVAALARYAVSALLQRIEAGAEDAPGHSIRVRVSAYRSPIVLAAGLLFNVLAVLGLLQVFGLGGLTWLFSSEVGHRIASGVGTIALTIGLALLVWEGVNIAIQRHLTTLSRNAQAARSARLRTLLPLFRTALVITVVVVAGLMVLSEVGVNIAPLLAGAGIIGVAIGFGSQKLVQDVITGVFLLLENTMQVGDIVRVGDQSGTVESLSVRTIRLRTEDGSVVVMPFSGVSTVVNMTRDFSRAVISVNVATTENVDHVLDAMRGILKEMRGETAWESIILDDLEVWGLDKFTDSSLLIKCRIMCTPFGRWPVGREFNRRMKLRFEEIGIEMPDSRTRLILDAAAISPAAPVVSTGG